MSALGANAIAAAASLDFVLEAGAPATAVPAVDVYGAIHKGLRYALCELVERAGLTSPHDASGTQRILDDLEGTLYLLIAHGEHEEQHLHSALEARRAGSSAPFVATHDALDQRATQLRALACAFTSSAQEQRAGRWRAFYLRLASYAAAQLAHMSDEEERAQPLLDALYGEGELRAIHLGLVRSVGPDERLAALRIMLLGATPDERMQLLAGARAALPAGVVDDLLASVRASLPPSELTMLAVNGAPIATCHS